MFVMYLVSCSVNCSNLLKKLICVKLFSYDDVKHEHIQYRACCCSFRADGTVYCKANLECFQATLNENSVRKLACLQKRRREAL